MRIRVDKIARNGRRLGFELGDEEMIQAIALGIEARVVAVTGQLMLIRTQGGVRVEAEGAVDAERACDRCGESAPFRVEVSESLVYVSGKNLDRAGEFELSDEEMDLGFFDGLSLNREEVLTEVFALAAPVRVICARPSCRDAASATPETVRSAGHPAFAALKGKF